MKLIDWFWLGLLLVGMAMLFGLKVEIKPFKITVEHWKLGTAFLLFAISLSFFESHYKSKGYEKGYKEAVEDFDKLLKKAVEEAEVKKQVDNTQSQS